MRAKRVFTLVIILLSLAACSGGNDAAASSVEAYFEALVNKNIEQLINHSCASWEDEARPEMESFAGVETTLEGLACVVTGESGNFTVVTCQGKILATYGEEIMEFDLSTYEYMMASEGGEWRFCGRR